MPIRVALRDLATQLKTSHLGLVQRVLLVIVFGCLPIQSGCSDIHLSIGQIPRGILSSSKDELPLQSEQEIDNALQMAVDDVVDRQLLPNITIEMVVNKIEAVPASLDEVMRSQVVTIFGHTDTCDQITSVLKSRNRIVISSVCGDEKLSNKALYPTFLRTRPPDTQMVESMLALLQHYDLNSIALIIQNTSKWRAVADSLERRRVALLTHNITVHHRMYFDDNRLCCALRQPCCRVAWSHEIFKKVKSSTTVYIFLGEKLSLRIFTQTIQDLEMWRANRYLVISCDPEAFSTSWAVNFLQHPRQLEKQMDENNWDRRGVLMESRKFNVYSHKKEAEWLTDLPQLPKQSYYKDSKTGTTPGTMMVVRNIANEHLKDFTRRLRLFSSNKGTISPEEVSTMPSSIYAAYAYDAIMVYVQALAFLVKKYNLSGRRIVEAAHNGSALFNTILEIQNFSSVRGGFISFDANGDSEDSYIAVGSKDLFLSKNKSSHDVPVMIPCGYFRGRVFHPTKEINQTVYLRLVKAKGGYEDEFIHVAELLDDNINVMMIVAHLLAIVGMAYTFVCKTKKAASKMDRITIRVEGLTDSELCAYLLNSKQMRVMNYNFHTIKDDWRMKVWNKSLKLPTSWCTLNCETFGEIRRMQRLQHDNVNPLIYAIIEPARICLIYEFQARKSLLDILSQSAAILLHCKTIASIALDLVNGIIYLQSTKIKFHGNLKSSNCLVDSSWNLKITDFGLHNIRKASRGTCETDRDYFFNLLWTAPEHLRNTPVVGGSPEGDVYSFAIILHELVCRQGPFAICNGLGDPMKVVNQVKQVIRGNQIPVRPPVETLNCRVACMFPCMVDCWTEDPNERPSFLSVQQFLTKVGGNLNPEYKKTLQSGKVFMESCDDEKRALEEEIQQIDAVLHRIIPKSVANSLANGLPVEAELWENVTVFEADLVGFTKIAAETTPLGTMILLDDVYTLFDSIARGYDVCKVGTIGDAYIVVSGIQGSQGLNSAGEIASMALEVVEKMKKSGIDHRGKPLVVRIGVHTGQVATGVVGSTNMPSYSIFGDTVSIASRLESTSSELRIQISEASYQALQQIGGYITEERHDRDDAESFKTYWLIGHTEKAVHRREKDVSSCPQPLCNRQSIISLTKTDIFIDPSVDENH